MNLVEAAAHAREVEAIETVRVAVLAAKRVAYQMKFSEDQARDDSGRWTDGGGGSTTFNEYEGEPGNRQHITRTETGTIPTSMLAKLSGARGEQPGEHRNRQGEKWDAFKADIATGMRDPIFITVDPHSEPRISEGNHRRDAAVELGMSHVPVEIRYYGQAEREGTVQERAKRGQKGDASGHEFHGNRYTGGIGGGERTHATFTPPPEEQGRMGTKTLLVKRAEREKAGGLTHEWGGTNEQAFTSDLKAHIMQTVSRESGLSPQRVDSFTKTWARSSTDSVADSVAMQQAIAEKFNLPMGSYLQERADYMRGGYRKDLLTTGQIEEIGRNVKAFNEEANQRLTGRRSEVGQILPPEGGGVEGTQASHDFFEAIHQQDAMLEPLNLHNAAIEASIENGDDYSKFDKSEEVNQNLGKEVDPELVTPYKVAFAAYQDSGISYTVDARNLFRGEGADEAMSFDQRVADARKYVDEVYKETQFTLKTWGVKYLSLDRGMSLKEAPPRTLTKIEFDANPLSSWSADARIALRFAYHDVTSSEDSPNPWWLKAIVPADKVFALPFTGPGCYNENEVVCIKGDYDVLATQGPAPS